MPALDVLAEGEVNATVLALGAPISFWGGVDYLTGKIIDASHPQHGTSVSGTCLLLPGVRGSGGTPGALAHLISEGKGPAGIVLCKPDINVLAGVMVAEQLYGKVCPVFVASPRTYAEIELLEAVTILPSGVWRDATGARVR